MPGTVLGADAAAPKGVRVSQNHTHSKGNLKHQLQETRAARAAPEPGPGAGATQGAPRGPARGGRAGGVAAAWMDREALGAGAQKRRASPGPGSSSGSSSKRRRRRMRITWIQEPTSGGARALGEGAAGGGRGDRTRADRAGAASGGGGVAPARPSLPAPPAPGRSPHLEHKPDEDAKHQAEADVRMVVDDELLAEERRAQGSRRRGPHPPLRSLASEPRKLLQLPGPPPARPARNNFSRPRPLCPGHAPFLSSLLASPSLGPRNPPPPPPPSPNRCPQPRPPRVKGCLATPPGGLTLSHPSGREGGRKKAGVRSCREACGLKPQRLSAVPSQTFLSASPLEPLCLSHPTAPPARSSSSRRLPLPLRCSTRLPLQRSRLFWLALRDPLPLKQASFSDLSSPPPSPPSRPPLVARAPCDSSSAASYSCFFS
ncbi:WAS/WASL-interacting protein family member 3-like [Vombatus ursinus]|uniref:WAS/WASL-interacting protein family member 3-like n=1 Tax=Vombatus ursinus TaxID=29139 RepID=UPI000FFD2DE0|nr:WAS/WASL-interacting protein family member 3-like [Vombatus ursinus]